MAITSYDLDSVVARLAATTSTEGGDDAVPGPNRRMAAVAAILRAGGDGQAEVLLMHRAERQGDPWSGHMAFPGGRHEEGDVTLVHTAIRETFEEVGLDLNAHGRFVARLPVVEAMAKGRFVGLTVAPFVFIVPPDAADKLTLNQEVAAVFWAPIGPFARGEVATTFEQRYEQALYRLPGFRVGERVVWGLTYRMLETLFERLHAANA